MSCAGVNESASVTTGRDEALADGGGGEEEEEGEEEEKEEDA